MRQIRRTAFAVPVLLATLRVTVLGALLGAVLGAVLAVPASPAAAAVPVTKLSPAALPRGADVKGPHLEGRTIVDGPVRLPVAGQQVRLLGKMNKAYSVVTGDAQGAHGRLYRVDASGQTLLGDAELYASLLGADGDTVVTWSSHGEDRTLVRVLAAGTGTPLAQHRFQGYVSVLDADSDRVLVGGQQSTVVWSPSTGGLSIVVRRAGYAGDLSAGLVATYTKDPFLGGCTEVLDIATGAARWRSCGQRVEAFSRDGGRMATVDKLSDGIGPSYVVARTTSGRVVGRYAVQGWFGLLTWESPTALLLPTNGQRRAAVVRCTGATCERAGALTRPEQARTSG